MNVPLLIVCLIMFTICLASTAIFLFQYLRRINARYGIRHVEKHEIQSAAEGVVLSSRNHLNSLYEEMETLKQGVRKK